MTIEDIPYTCISNFLLQMTSLYTDIKFLVSDIHILGYENSKLTHFPNNYSKKVKCTPKI